ncbi:hypothetical protein Rmet_6504 [Cupriavidus metallidurans CH34]|uniref:Uncharacterized protein n=1 Tax=Cupriavidus metallidurans (strain ATCC 43123 / DSM 2839 / NBRC 102507 / CH34) TaxID=266264 RepID=D3DXU2_CUPMC|nr:hypothetical protein Rmet_6504 [Cupriavidus metallidurans CH34]
MGTKSALCRPCTLAPSRPMERPFRPIRAHNLVPPQPLPRARGLGRRLYLHPLLIVFIAASLSGAMSRRSSLISAGSAAHSAVAAARRWRRHSIQPASGIYIAMSRGSRGR